MRADFGPRSTGTTDRGPRDLARSWAQSFGFPGAPPSATELPQVAQFLATVENPNLVRSEFRKYLTNQLIERHRRLVPGLDSKATPDDLLAAVAAAWWTQDPPNPYALLAALPCPIYITTNPDNLLPAALRAVGKTPQVELCRWLEDERWPPLLKDKDRDPPTVDRPLVYHLFGSLVLPFSLVLKEDDYFDYLVGVTRLREWIPAAVRAALTDGALLFLGFHLDDWGFRVLFRSIIGPSAPSRQEQHPHVAVQLDSRSADPPEPAALRRYLQSYFESADVTIYWGRVGQFLQDFQANWQRYQAEEA